MNLRIVLAAAAASVVLFGCNTVGTDLETFCRVAGAVKADASVPNEKKHSTFIVRAQSELKNDGVKKVVNALGYVSGRQRIQILNAGMNELGHGDFMCPAYSDIAAM